MLWELLAADVEGVEGIGAVGTVFENGYSDSDVRQYSFSCLSCCINFHANCHIDTIKVTVGKDLS